MSNSDSDADKASNGEGSSNPTTSRRPKRSATKQLLVETDSSAEEDNAVKIAKLKAKKPKKGPAKNDLSDDDILKNVDRKEASALNDLDREMLIYERLKQNEIKKQREEIRRSLLAKDKSKKQGKGGNSSDEFNHDGFNSSSESEGEIREPKNKDEDPDMDYHRPSEVSAKRNKKKAMDELLSKRRDKEEKRKEQDKNRAVLDIDEIFGGVGARSSSSSSTSSESSRSSGSSRSPSPEVKKEVENLDDLELCRISRATLARFVHCPFFNKLAIGCYARIGIGAGEHGGRAVYRIVEIIDVVESTKVYMVEGTRTNKGLKLRSANDTRVYRLEFISNQPFEEKEWLWWLTAMRSKNVPLPTMDQIQTKQKEIAYYMAYNLSSAELDYMIKEKQRFMNAPTNYAVEKSRLMKIKLDAEEQGNISRAKEIQREIDDLDAKADDIEHQRSGKLSAVALINQKRRVEMQNNFLGPKKMEYESAKEDDPFTRKSNRTKVVSGFSKKNKGDEALDPTIELQNYESNQVPGSSQNGDDSQSQPILAKKFQSLSTAGITKTNLNGSNVKQFAGHGSIELDLDI